MTSTPWLTLASTKTEDDVPPSNPQDIRYHREARGDAPTLVFLHGAGCDRHFWTRLFDAMEPTPFGLFAATLPGRPPNPDDPCKTITEMAAWVRQTLQSEGIDAPVIIGHSMGGAIALELACQAEEDTAMELTALGLLATGARLRVHPNIFKMLREMGDQDSGTLLPWRPSTPQAVIDEYMGHGTPPIATTFADWKATSKFDKLGQIPAFSCPTLIVGGDEDPLTPPKFSEYLHQNIPGSALHILPDGGHMFPVERPTALADCLSLWLKS